MTSLLVRKISSAFHRQVIERSMTAMCFQYQLCWAAKEVNKTLPKIEIRPGLKKKKERNETVTDLYVTLTRNYIVLIFRPGKVKFFQFDFRYEYYYWLLIWAHVAHMIRHTILIKEHLGLSFRHWIHNA